MLLLTRVANLDYLCLLWGFFQASAPCGCGVRARSTSATSQPQSVLQREAGPLDLLSPRADVSPRVGLAAVV